MTITTFKELIDDAERALGEIVERPRLEPGPLIAAWPDFHRMAVHALSAASGARPSRWFAVDHLTDGPPIPPAKAAVPAPDPAMRHAARLLGAAGDLLASAPRTAPDDALLDDELIRAAQSRVAGILAAGAHLIPSALHEACVAGQGPAHWQRRVSAHATRVEQLAASIMRHAPRAKDRVEDLAVIAAPGDAPALEDAVETWARHARDTLTSRHPSARDLQGLAGDIAQVAAHSRVLVRGAGSAGALDLPTARALDAILGQAVPKWLDAAHAWDGMHTVTGATPEKIAASHALGRALGAVTRDGKDWATPNAVARRLDPDRALRVVRRGQEVAREVADRQWPLASAIAEQGLLYIAPSRATTTTQNLHSRLRKRLVQAAPVDWGEPISRLKV